MRYILCLVIVVSGVVSCGVQGRTGISHETDALMLSQDTASVSRMARRIEEQLVRRMTEMAARLKVESERTVFSEPDSAGRQHVIEQVRTTASADVSQMEREDAAGAVSETSASDSLAASQSSGVVFCETDLDERRGAPWWQRGLMYAGLAALAAVILFIVCKIIKPRL